MKKAILKIGGMSCSACSSSLEKHLNKQKSIISASVNLVSAQALIEYEDNITINDLNNYIKNAGFISLGIYKAEKEEEKKKNKEFHTLLIFTILSVLFLYISMSHMIGVPTIQILDMKKHPINYAISQLVLTIPYLIYGFDILKKGIINLFHKTPNMDTLVTIGVISSFIFSIYSTVMILLNHVIYTKSLYFESCAIVIFFIKLGRFIDQRSKEKTQSAIKELVQITPDKTLLKKENKEMEVTLDEIKKDDILIAKPGMKIAVDGIIIKGITHLDEALITGESAPVKKQRNDNVVAGSINLDGYIEYSAKKIGKDSTISEIVRLVVEATNTKAPIAHLADRVSTYFVPTILLISIITFIAYLVLGYSFSFALEHFVTVLVVACPCALGLATPLAIVVSEGLCAKNGILVKASKTLENAHKVDTIIFDKTGTLTYGNLTIASIFNYSNYNEKELIHMVGSIEKKSTHPISKAFINYMKKNDIHIKEVNNFKNLSGIGISATIDKKEIFLGNNKLITKLKLKNTHESDEENLKKLGNTIVYVIENKKIIALIGIKDIIRDNARSTIDKLRKLNKEVIMLTGDNEQAAKIIAKEVNIDHVIADVLPKEKTNVIKKLSKEGKKVMMVGDGINDAPSLATSLIGISVNSGTDIATNSADVILMTDNLEKIINLITISKKTIKNIKQNLFWAFFYNICMIPIAVGIFENINISMNPMIASFAMTISSLTVVFNALRLKKIKLETRNNNV